MKRSCLLLVSGAISVLGIAPPAFAEPVTRNTEFSVTVNPYLNVTLSSNDVHLPITPSSGGTYGSAYFTATASTNNALGYSLNLSIKDTNTAAAQLTTNLTPDTINVNDGTKPVIPTFSTNDVLTSAEFSASTSADHLNHWAMSLNDTDHYQKVVSESTIATSDEPIADDVTTLNLATKIDLLTPPGSYSAYFNFEIVANVVPEPETPIDAAMRSAEKTRVTVVTDADGDGTEEEVSLYTMQDMSSSICNAITTPTSESDTPEGQLVDTRDNKVYWVAKLKDGHCWMTQNLDLNLTGTALNSNNTDLTTYGTNGYDSSNGYSQSGDLIYWQPENATITASGINEYGDIDGWADDANNPYSVDIGKWYWIGNWKNNGVDTWYNSTVHEYFNTTSDHTGGVFAARSYAGNRAHGHVGNWYNWAAAIASNNASSFDTSTYDNPSANPKNSICPAG